MSEHPIQPTELDSRGVLRFKKNHLIELMLDAYGQNKLCAKHGSERWFREDYDQLLQLIGYSVSGAPISDSCRGRVECVAQNMEPSFSAGYSDGFKDAIARIREAIDEVTEAEE